MRLLLTGLKKLEMKEAETHDPEEGFRFLKVQYCAICRTDAKMWNEGHRDLVLPRVLGHELIASEADGKRFAIWPGRTCGECAYCLSGRENLCEEMKIMGFHHDGGFSNHVMAPSESLIPVDDHIPPHVASLAEPAGCVLNALEPLDPQKGERIIIYGGGSVGLMAALACREMGVIPLVIEKDEKKIERSEAFQRAENIIVRKETTDSEFDMALNACADPTAFSMCVAKLAKGGRLSFFGGLTKNKDIETNLLNLMHYKEMTLRGAYGLTRKNLKDALILIGKKPGSFEKLIEEIIPPERAAELMPDILSGKTLKFVIDFSGNGHKLNLFRGKPDKDNPHGTSSAYLKTGADNVGIPDADFSGYGDVLDAIRLVPDDIRAEAVSKMDNKTKPLGSLGSLEDLALRICFVQNTLNPRVDHKSILVFAGDHGVVEEGVSAYPASVTGEMVKNFLNGGAAINVLCRQFDIDMSIVDMGVNADFPPHPMLFDKKVRKGTRNFALEEAMTPEEAEDAVSKGMAVFFSKYASKKIDMIGLGEMGIGNTTSASAIICAITGITPAQATGRGTGLDDKGMERKAEIIENVLKFHNPDSSDGFDILRKIGGYEIAGIVGAVLAAVSKGTVVVLDGVISTAAGLVAYTLKPEIGGYLISGHKSVEVAQQAALSHMGLEPVIDFGMRLGEGTGAAITMNVADTACRIMREMASFEEAGVSNKD
ncbi:MAG: nicotinate-nucleotide--dimethylbenzimidazole phosphoribosyltransferase [Deltaproteobacteria bacterium]|nr:nicotinate-nucleotide--dimethylbenzimidazole phosphoribosyltransferase [Deltaproteobacteria bacterium]